MKNNKGETEMELKWNWSDLSKIRFGHYNAKVLMIYDDGAHDVPVEGEVSFWVIPWRIIGGALIIFIVLLLGLRSALSGIFRKNKNK